MKYYSTKKLADIKYNADTKQGNTTINAIIMGNNIVQQ